MALRFVRLICESPYVDICFPLKCNYQLTQKKGAALAGNH